jgi:manganese oxidase
MGGMFTVIKVRDDLATGDFRDPGWYSNPAGTVARRIDDDVDINEPIRRAGARQHPA